MAQKVQVLLMDDLDGTDASETVRFGLDGVAYEIDLSAGNAGQLRGSLADYVSHARKAGGSQRRSARRGSRAADAQDIAGIRTWAREQGYDIKDRGRVPADLVAKYQAEH
jgi:Lsr2